MAKGKSLPDTCAMHSPSWIAQYFVNKFPRLLAMQAHSLMADFTTRVERSIEQTDQALAAHSRVDYEALSEIITGQRWLANRDDQSRHYDGMALKVDTFVLLDGTADLLTVNVEVSSGGHTGAEYLVTVIPTVRAQRFYCLACADKVTERLEVHQFQRVDIATPGKAPGSLACFLCGETPNKGKANGALIRMQHHVNLGRTTVSRPCGCPDMTLRGKVLGEAQHLTADDLVMAVREVRAYVESAQSVRNLGRPVRAQSQHDSNQAVARNLWRDDVAIKRAKVTTARASVLA